MFAAAALAILSIAFAAGARLTGAGHMTVAPTPVEIARDFRFDDAGDGSVVVLASALDASGGEREIARLRAGEMMFVRSTVRALGRQRKLDGMPLAAAPFRVTRYVNGRLTLDDPSTGAHLELASFGPTNEAAFAQLLDRAR
jgi:putative photosynthetic complex assembly protein